jgi:hypothetical protein
MTALMGDVTTVPSSSLRQLDYSLYTHLLNSMITNLFAALASYHGHLEVMCCFKSLAKQNIWHDIIKPQASSPGMCANLFCSVHTYKLSPACFK